MNMTADKIFGVVRAVVAAAAGYLAGKGMIDGANVDAIVSGVTLLLVSVWSWRTKPAE
jgi:hypothetical protein